MFQNLLSPIGFVAFLSGALLVPSLTAGESNVARTNGQSAQTEELRPFTHLAYIPAGAEFGAIRFEKLRIVKVPTTVSTTADANYCAELALRDPGGSMFCPSTKTGSLVPAYEVTYSFIGQPMSSDESGSRYFTFTVDFRPEEFTPEAQLALSAKQMNRADAAGYFAVNTQRERIRHIAIDTAQSKFCAGSHIDGAWTHDDRECKDDVRYTMATTPSDYITVRVDPVSPRSSVGIAAVSAKR